MLMPEPFHREHDGYLRRSRQTSDENIIGFVREFEGQRKDGSVFPLELSISETKIPEGRMFTGIVRDITDCKQSEMAKNEFVSIVSHELRTPLTSIKGSLGLVRGEALGAIPAKVKSMVDIAYANCERLVELINDILDIEKIESGKVDFQMRPLEIGSLFSDVLEITGGLALVGILALTAWRIADGDTSLGNFVGVIGAVAVAAPEVRALGTLNAVAQEGGAAADRVLRR